MIFLAFGLLLAALWYMADKNLKDEFLPYLKWPGLAIIAIFLLTEVYFFVETSRFIDARTANGDLGLGYSYYDNSTNSTVEHTIYAKQDISSGNVIAFHALDAWVMEDMIGMLPYLALMAGLGIVFQYLYIAYNGFKEVR